MKKYITIISIFFLFTSCESIFYKMYGIKKMDAFNETEYLNSVEKMSIKDSSVQKTSIISELENFEAYIKKFSSSLGEKNIKQPIQILYFTKNSLKSFSANCYAKGDYFGNLNWNYKGDFDFFIPKSAINIPSTTPSLDNIFKIFKIEKLENNDITIVFFWNNMFSKQSKEAFQTISENLYKRKDNVFINLILINTDIPYIDFFKTSKKTSNKQMP